MERGNVDIKLIEKAKSRLATCFMKRKAGLLKKAQELSILCDAEVAVILFSNSGKLYEYSSSSMKRTLSKYTKCAAAIKTKSEVKQQSQALALVPLPLPQPQQQEQEHKEVNTLKDDVSKLMLKQLRLGGKDLKSLSLNELQQLEHQLNEGLLAVKDKKEGLLIQKLEDSRKQEERVMVENETLRRQIEELQGLPLSASLPTSYPKDKPSEKKYSIGKDSVFSLESDAACDHGVNNDHSDTTLQLWPTSSVRKRKAPEPASTSCSDNQLTLTLS